MAVVRRYESRDAIQETKEDVFHLKPAEMPADEKEDLRAIRLEVQQRAQASRNAQTDDKEVKKTLAEQLKEHAEDAKESIKKGILGKTDAEETPAKEPEKAPEAEPAKAETPKEPEKTPEKAAEPEPPKEAPKSETPKEAPVTPAKTVDEKTAAARYTDEQLRAFMRPEPRQPELPLRSSALVNYAPFDGDVFIGGSLLLEAQRAINLLHDYNKVDERLKTLAIQAIAADDKWATNVIKKAKNRKPVEYAQQKFFYLTDRTGQPVKNPTLYPSFEEAKKSLGLSAARLKELEARKADFSKVISSSLWYVDAEGKRIQPVSKGLPPTPPVKYNVSSSLVKNGAEYICNYHDSTKGTPVPELADLLEQIALGEPEVLDAIKAEKARRDLANRPKMRVGYYIDSKRHPYATKREAEDAYLADYERRFGAEFTSLADQICEDDVEIPAIKAWAYQVTDFGGFGEPIADKTLVMDFLREEGVIK